MRRALISAAVLVAALSACGSTKSKVAANSTATTVAGGSTATTAPSFSGNSNSTYCDLARQAEGSAKVNPTTDMKANFAKFNAISGQFVSKAPGAIKADAQTLVTGVKKLEALLASVNYDFTKLSASSMASLNDPALTAASLRIVAYDKQVCGLTNG